MGDVGVVLVDAIELFQLVEYDESLRLVTDINYVATILFERDDSGGLEFDCNVFVVHAAVPNLGGLNDPTIVPLDVKGIIGISMGNSSVKLIWLIIFMAGPSF